MGSFLISVAAFFFSGYPWSGIPWLSIFLLGGCWGIIFFYLFQSLRQEHCEEEE
jgi:hypothetical protein